MIRVIAALLLLRAQEAGDTEGMFPRSGGGGALVDGQGGAARLDWWVEGTRGQGGQAGQEPRGQRGRRGEEGEGGGGGRGRGSPAHY